MKIKLKKLISEVMDLTEEEVENFIYPKIDIDTKPQPEVKEAINRFRKMTPEERENAGPLLYWLLGGGTPPYKVSQEDSQYTDEAKSEDQTCSNCEFLYMKHAKDLHICSQIEGEVQPAGWCKYWKQVK